ITTFDCEDVGSVTVTLTVTDENGNTATCTATVTVEDNVDPMAVCQDVTVQLDSDGNGFTTADAVDNGSSDACDINESSLDITNFDCGDVGSVIVALTVTDENSNSATCTATVTVEDNVAPMPVCQDVIVQLGNDGNGSTTADAVDNGSTDACGIDDLSLDINTFDCNDLGTNTVTLTVTDVNGNMSTCTATVTVNDITNPVFPDPDNVTIYTSTTDVLCPSPASVSGLPANQTIVATDADDEFSFTVHGTTQYAPTEYSDNCSEGEDLALYLWSINVNHDVNNCSRQIRIIWRVYDASNNYRQRDQIFTIVDDKAPVFAACPTNVIDLGCNPSVLPGIEMAIDEAGEVTDECGVLEPIVAIGTEVPEGCDKTQVWTVTATDPCGNSTPCVVTFIWVEDEVAPAFAACPTNAIDLGCNPSVLPGIEMAIDEAGEVTDNCDPAIAASSSAVTGECNKTQVWAVTATDSCNATATCMVTYIWVDDTEGPTFSSCPTGMIEIDLGCNPEGSSEMEFATAAVGTISDNCGSGYIQPPTGGMINGDPCARTRTWTVTATDPCSNVSACNVTFVWQESTPVVLTCPSDISVAACQTQGDVDLAFNSWLETADATGGCSLGEVVPDITVAPNYNGGSVTVTFIVTSDCEEPTTCTASFTVTDCRRIEGKLIWKGDGNKGVAKAWATLRTVPGGVLVDSFALTNTTGSYSLEAAPGIYAICPARDNADLLNGVSSADATAIQKHLSNMIPITSFYRFIAADCNNDNKISTVDAAIINQALLGNISALNKLRATGSWRFIPTAFPAPGLFGPYTVPFYPRKDTVNITLADSLAQNFFGVKTADVVTADTGNANPHLKPDPDAKALVWRVQDRVLKAGELVDVEFAAANFTNLAAFQHGMYFDPTALRFESALGLSQEVPMTESNNFGANQAEQGELRTLWSVDEGITLTGVQPVYRLRFTALKGGLKLSQVLSLKAEILEVVAFTDDLLPREVQLVFADIKKPGSPGLGLQVGIENAEAFDLLSNRPNPFSDRTTIAFILPEACNARLRIFDLSGRELWRSDKAYPAGYHEEVVNLNELDSTGLLFYELTTPQGKQTRKMMAVKF
ncbi:MAG: T9SS type A sorting domain-containing protein, partial [Saprospiraceae bacterium]